MVPEELPAPVCEPACELERVRIADAEATEADIEPSLHDAVKELTRGSLPEALGVGGAESVSETVGVGVSEGSGLGVLLVLPLGVMEGLGVGEESHTRRSIEGQRVGW
jgi:hypothetical protein